MNISLDKIKDFKDYLNSFYGKVDGIYPSKRIITLDETKQAIEYIIEKYKTFFGDSLDRERARDFLFSIEEQEQMFKYRKKNYVKTN